MSAVSVRPRVSDDVPELAQVLIRVHARDRYPVEGVARAEDWVAPDRELAAWTALHEGQPIGHVSVTQADPDSEVAILWQQHTEGAIERLAIPVRLFVDPDHRNTGVGRMLLAAVGQYASRRNLAIAFDVMLKDRDAIRLYEDLGCRRIGEVVHQHSGGETEPAAVYLAPNSQ
ncbi:GNAT family N-acetyltransferase [Nocardia sp. NPDC005366]|uniref:GNAT family N-acetyltransferase n=1 Tax=Nocardia sp. NPDC005366 TaxID=3156878 RepID=UPI0033BA9B1B